MTSRLFVSEVAAFLAASFSATGGFGPEQREALAHRYPRAAAATYEIKQGGRWLKVDAWIFRSWTGARRVDSVPYAGANFYLGNAKEVAV